jgi:hypothetical protein
MPGPRRKRTGAKLFPAALLLFLASFSAPGSHARADEGMWLPNRPPRELLRSKYHFDLNDAWRERVQKASVRFNNGGSGGFVSPDGLVVTNHHIGAGCLQKLSPPGKDYYRDGFHARTRAEEPRCPDLELNVLESIEDVTARVQAAVKSGLKPAEVAAARRAVLTSIENESKKQTGLRSDVVTLFQGGAYHLYRYRRYTDVRLVFAPEKAVASFGGDVDNFEYPRFDLDVCFFRVYEGGKPLAVKHYFRWSTKGPAEGDLVFVTGHPGSTNRLETLARLKHRRDVTLPYTLNRLRYVEALLQQFSERGPGQRRMAEEDLYPVANARKALTGQYHGLLDPAVVARKQREEEALREALAPQFEGGKPPDPWARIDAAQRTLAPFEKEYALLELGDAFHSRYFRIARHLARLAEEKEKPNEKRLREYRESALDSLRLQLFSPAPIHAGLERVKLAGSLAFLAQNLGGEHPLVVQVLAGKSPEARAAELTAGTRLGDVAERRRLAEGGAAAVRASDDAMLRLARLIDGEARRLRRRYEDEVAEPEQQAYADLAAARNRLPGGREVAPDATFTLRLAFGVVKGYREGGRDVPFATAFAGAFRRAEEHGQREPFALPESWRRHKDRLDLTTPFNFVSTADTIGGNSGSPVLNRSGELIGINFDRNRHGLVRNYVYTEEQARHISVHCLAVLEALRVVYGAEVLVKELTGS